MKIEVWSDFVCPFCYIGKRRLEKALDNFEHRENVEVEYKSFELDPNSPVNSEKTIHEAIAEKYNMSLDEAKKTNENIGNQAKTVGLTYHFDNMIPTNTFMAHRLVKFAKKFNKDTAITEQLLHGYFTENINLGDHDTLANIAESVGLDREQSLEILHDENAYAKEVRDDEALAKKYGVSGVPFFIINSKYAISGAQPLETFTSALEKVWAEEKPQFENLSSTDNGVCTDDSCNV
ncbi:DsbA family protein [Paraliobacillus sp. JSM ZJ581]|uniref:DsbA family oxidoreductase n=1 Tax=Paraliobacillus sp. JSM ZJ581 TaxID=3342118 RepID=UPI0035A9395B